MTISLPVQTAACWTRAPMGALGSICQAAPSAVAPAGGRSRGGHLVAAPPGAGSIARAEDPEGGGGDPGRGDGDQDPDPGAPGRGVPPGRPTPTDAHTGETFCGTEGRPCPVGRNGRGG